MTAKQHLAAAMQILLSLGFPKAQQNERSALTLLALLDLVPGKNWSQAEAPMMGITPIIDWMRRHYKKGYAPNTRETVRRQSMHQFVSAGIAVRNPDAPSRATNSPDTVYQIDAETLSLLRLFNTPAWDDHLVRYLAGIQTLSARYAREREQLLVPVRTADGKEVSLGAGKHSELIREIVESFASRFVPGAVLIYAGGTAEKWVHFEATYLATLGVEVEAHGKMPDVVLHWPRKNWLILAEAVTSHGPVDGKRHAELAKLFAGSKADLVYLTAFPNRALMGRYLGQIAWETEVWVADAPSHLIHFNGDRFLGPHSVTESHTGFE